MIDAGLNRDQMRQMNREVLLRVAAVAAMVTILGGIAATYLDRQNRDRTRSGMAQLKPYLLSGAVQRAELENLVSPRVRMTVESWGPLREVNWKLVGCGPAGGSCHVEGTVERKSGDMARVRFTFRGQIAMRVDVLP